MIKGVEEEKEAEHVYEKEVKESENLEDKEELPDEQKKDKEKETEEKDVWVEVVVVGVIQDIEATKGKKREQRLGGYWVGVVIWENFWGHHIVAKAEDDIGQMI